MVAVIDYVLPLFRGRYMVKGINTVMIHHLEIACCPGCEIGKNIFMDIYSQHGRLDVVSLIRLKMRLWDILLFPQSVL